MLSKRIDLEFKKIQKWGISIEPTTQNQDIIIDSPLFRGFSWLADCPRRRDVNYYMFFLNFEQDAVFCDCTTSFTKQNCEFFFPNTCNYCLAVPQHSKEHFINLTKSNADCLARCLIQIVCLEIYNSPVICQTHLNHKLSFVEVIANMVVFEWRTVILRMPRT